MLAFARHPQWWSGSGSGSMKQKSRQAGRLEGGKKGRQEGRKVDVVKRFAGGGGAWMRRLGGYDGAVPFRIASSSFGLPFSVLTMTSDDGRAACAHAGGSVACPSEGGGWCAFLFDPRRRPYIRFLGCCGGDSGRFPNGTVKDPRYEIRGGGAQACKKSRKRKQKKKPQAESLLSRCNSPFSKRKAALTERNHQEKNLE